MLRACCLLCKCRTKPSLLDKEHGQPGIGHWGIGIGGGGGVGGGVHRKKTRIYVYIIHILCFFFSLPHFS